ncbi:MAG TPA: ATP-dependent DNA ligase [Galbitalea sp.]
MGTLQYDGVLVEFDDRLLAHLQIVIVQKIRRGESFLMSWRDAPETGDGHSAIWIHPTQNLYFKFMGSRSPAINQDWLEQLTLSANSPRGLLVMREGSKADTPTNADVAESKSAGKATPAPHIKAVETD